MSRYRRAMRPSLRHGLPYGWWKSTDFWEGLFAFVMMLMFGMMFGVIVSAWFLDWQPTW